jgi:hypothetical protein
MRLQVLEAFLGGKMRTTVDVVGGNPPAKGRRMGHEERYCNVDK